MLGIFDVSEFFILYLCHRRTTRSNADRNCWTDTIVKLFAGVTHHFVHIFRVNDDSDSPAHDAWKEKNNKRKIY